uniref:Protein phosphatase inhibitor 2 n=1 Tax=Schistosoma haematobium TaxID=6185 RepID=A0A095A3M1_SCHHA
MSKATEERKVSKSILKKSSDQVPQKSFQWDESNILATYHPADKTYGHMKIEEPKTPYVFDPEDGSAVTSGPLFTAEDLAARLSAASKDPDQQLLYGFNILVLNTKALCRSAISEPSATKVDQEEDEHQRKFREKRKQHYNEFLAVKLAKESLQNDDEEGENIEKEDEVEHNVEQAMINARLNAEISRLSRNTEQPISSILRNQNLPRSHL